MNCLPFIDLWQSQCERKAKISDLSGGLALVDSEAEADGKRIK